MTGRALVTGISGFIGGHVALALLYAGYTVRGSIRDLGRAEGVALMLGRAGADLRRLELVELDLLSDEGWGEAMVGCRYLIHVASPLVVRQPTDRDELIRPAVEGTRRAVGMALAADVERIVVTSSAAAISQGHPVDRAEPFTAADWSATDGPDVTAYTESKTRAELEAWSLAEDDGRRLDLATINPVVTLGPLLDADAAVSPLLIQRLLDGGIPFAPGLYVNLVDVRDVAALHLAAMASPLAGGQRLIAAAGALSVLQLAQGLKPSFPAFAARLPRHEAPDWLVRLLAMVSPEVRDAAGGLGLPARRFDTLAAETLLGRPFITPRLAAAATAQSLIDLGLVRPPRRRPAGEKRD